MRSYSLGALSEAGVGEKGMGWGVTCKGRRRHVQLHLPGGTWETTKHSILSSVHLTWNGSRMEVLSLKPCMPELLLWPHLGGGRAGGRGSAGITKRREAGFHFCGVLRSLSISPGCVVRLCHTVDLVSSPLLGFHSAVDAGIELACVGSSPVSLGRKITFLKLGCKFQGKTKYSLLWTLPCWRDLGAGGILFCSAWQNTCPSLKLQSKNFMKTRQSLPGPSTPPTHIALYRRLCHQIQLCKPEKMNTSGSLKKWK